MYAKELADALLEATQSKICRVGWQTSGQGGIDGAVEFEGIW